MVITALMITAMVGFLGLAIDGGRIFVERRIDQNAVDATALGAADAYYGALQHTPPSSTPVADAFAAGLAEFAKQTGQPAGGWTTNGTMPTSCDVNPTSANYPPDPTVTSPPANEVRYSQGGFAVLISVWAAPNADIPGICLFNASAVHSISMVFIQVLGNFSSASVSTTATAVSAHAFQPPALLVLDPFPCGAGGTGNQALKIDGNQVLTINGITWSDGNIFRQNATVVANGDVFDHCDASVPFTPTPPNVGIGNAPTLPDPLANFPSVFNGASGFYAPYNANSNTDSTDAVAQNTVELEPGIYNNTNSFGQGSTAGCWFIEPGIYTWPGTQSQGSLIFNAGSVTMSNELTSPDGANPATVKNPPYSSFPNSGSALASNEIPQFNWNAAGETCHGKIQSYAGAGSPSVCVVLVSCAATYSFRFTSVRAECLPHTSAGGACAAANTYWRESDLSSTCLTVTGFGNLSKAQFGISNVPGMGNPIRADGLDTTFASEYHIYASSYGCNGPFGYVTKANFANGTGAQTNGALGGCPFLPAAVPATTNKQTFNAACSLGYTFSDPIDQNALGATFPAASPAFCTMPNGNNAAWTPTHGCQPVYLDPSNPNLGANVLTNPDTANEDYCAEGPTGATPGSLCSSFPNTGASGVTPGAAMMFFPATSTCIFQNQGAATVFGNLAWDGVVMYAAAPGVCSSNGAQINGGQGGQFIGEVYMPGPGLLLKVAGGGSPIDGAIDIWQLEVTGNSNTTLTGKFPHTVVVTPGSLITCTSPTSPTSTYCPPG
ncbi:MAG TPA: Tad domain-containing protein [Candidatus Dormibacteraeota bacterium]